MKPARRPATRAEARALAHPLRLRILRLCLDEALTNREIAERVREQPATVLYHVRTLVRNGFLGLGNKESIQFTSSKDRFVVIDRENRIFQKKEVLGVR